MAKQGSGNDLDYRFPNNDLSLLEWFSSLGIFLCSNIGFKLTDCFELIEFLSFNR